MDIDPREYWNTDAGPRWAAEADRLDAQLAPLGEAALDRARIREGQRVVDVGCGCGGSTFEIATRLGPSGSVRGVDFSECMLDVARERAGRQGLANVAFVRADAATHNFEDENAQHVFSRFGVMFFTDPLAAFANLRSALVPDGRLTFVCWDTLENNPWAAEPRAAAGKHVALPDLPKAGEPGPFAFASSGRVSTLLLRAGFRQASFAVLMGSLLVGGPGNLDAAVAFALSIGPAATAAREAPASVRQAIACELRKTLAPYQEEEGVRMPFRAWIVTALR